MGASISTAGGLGGGSITIRHNGGDLRTTFDVWRGLTNGTAGVLTTGPNNTIAPSRSFPGSHYEGAISIITADRLSQELSGLTSQGKEPEALAFNEQEPFLVDEYFTRQYDKYFENSPLTPIKSLDEIQRMLRRIENETGAKPAIIYAFFAPATSQAAQRQTPSSAPKGDLSWQFSQGVGFTNTTTSVNSNSEPTSSVDNRRIQIGCSAPNLPEACQLNLVLVTADDRPIRIPVTKANQQQVVETAKNLSGETQQLSSKGQYKQYSEKFYTWLIKPLERTLRGKGINNF